MRIEKISAKALDRLNGDRYKLALVVSKRADQLASGEEPLIDVDTTKVKAADIAIMEVAQGKVGLEALIDKD